MTVADAATEVRKRIRLTVEAVLDRKAVDVRVLELESVCDFADYFVICSGTSNRQVSAIADWVERQLRSNGAKARHVEGKRLGRWILMDYGDFLVHVLDPARRERYRLEEMWSDAPDATGEFVPSKALAES